VNVRAFATKPGDRDHEPPITSHQSLQLWVFSRLSGTANCELHYFNWEGVY